MAQANRFGPGGDIPGWAGDGDEPFDVAQFLLSRAAPVDNGATEYLVGLSRFSSAFGDSSLKRLEGAIRETANLDKLLADNFPDAQIEQLLDVTSGAVELIDVAQSKSRCVFVTPGFGTDVVVPHADAMLTLNGISILQLHQSIVHRDFSLADAAIRRSLRSSRDLQPRGLLACQLVSMAIDEALFDGIERLTLNDPQLTAEHCDRLMALLIEHQQQCLNRYDEGLRAEYITVRTTMNNVQNGRLSLQDVMVASGISDSSIPIGARLNFNAEIATGNRLFSMALLEASKSFADYTRQSIVRNELDRLASAARAVESEFGRSGSIDTPIIGLFMLPAIESMREANTRSATHLAGVQMLVALRRYEIMHHELPRTIGIAAAETALRTVPIDGFTGQPLRYAIVEGKPTVYSTGKDLTDDGGVTDWNHGTQPGDFLFVLTRAGSRPGKAPRM